MAADSHTASTSTSPTPNAQGGGQTHHTGTS
eukprot:CAMPEP_0174330088 /NCGR_PEP_ID=MMETSP0810-20121108/16387_1 /TAXON_ID=73025 ORGANISM="Eutreptiella gymnastica-like, Strain CCMP1594" /NCGR_SAMPLE_ID=MMETSP0810 /ASSEMBLY_ACC=CAM_ASM_000659 /LENGTH=30 /DNA_ID= /DNA_START= /DNA_END= /DNA_ORIENTATION=